MEETKPKVYGPLRGVIVARYGSLRAFARATGRTPNQVQRSLETGYKWKVADAVKYCEQLDIPPEQIPIFFIE